MRGVTFPGDRRVEIMNFDDPTPGPGEVVIEVKASGLCGSDLHAYRAPTDDAAFRELAKGKPYETMRDNGPKIAGHEPCGVVVAVGPGVSERVARLGQRVMIHHYSGCHVCDQCRTGWPQMCEEMVPDIYGWTAHGAHAKYMKCAAHTLVTLPEGLSFEAGAAIACGSGTSYAALRKVQPNASHTVAIFGQGPVGLSGTQFAAAMGARVIALDVNKERLETARRFGAAETINPAEVDAPEAIRELTHGRGAHFSIETSGAQQAIADAIKSLRLWGTAVFVGLGRPPVVDFASDVIFRQISLQGSFTFSTNIMEECAVFSVDRGVEVEAVFSDRWSLEQAAQAYDLLDKQSSGKGVIIF
ncbi:zinc-dependent alcohol dehydrogenase family protein [Celeribacter indicus]|uniref:Alcohol dehydrogenase n=1 Tax=Celeribacter indicus TaxID=1208324 RepID=A0A0B5DYE6_9RHOB|nr:zinc-binding dehydrogenase [Celeribacter indicus]AJE45217.1 alcohol dehydrogenase [Celeribacter indicus]SDX45531.1 D-arabinose 1-dehydrogenase, Zn-dependent alcohol dehydrogenase family [Celeribacter indicus]